MMDQVEEIDLQVSFISWFLFFSLRAYYSTLICRVWSTPRYNLSLSTLIDNNLINKIINLCVSHTHTNTRILSQVDWGAYLGTYELTHYVTIEFKEFLSFLKKKNKKKFLNKRKRGLSSLWTLTPKKMKPDISRLIANLEINALKISHNIVFEKEN